ncbi:hypothetical protein SDC9_181760 [bioreactor metagenome]|uniref:Secretion system C-terminal sorting domain-containing protein n=1 Tax=bioreactor metagenome TaxID=1076179 RepID=A0A645H5I0_9ZZZZ
MANTGDSLKRRVLLKYYDSNGNFLDSVKLPITNVSGITSITGDVVFFANSLGLYWFDPNIGLNDISDETESSYVDVWINSAYPNPVSNRLNIDILYYPSSILGNDLQVDLYNSIGQKVLDITPLGEYSESRNRFEANIDIPKHIPTGSYVISAVSGNVRRIRGIMIINN